MDEQVAFLSIDGRAQYPRPGGVMRQGVTLGLKEQLQFVTAQFGPIGKLLHTHEAGQLGQDGDRNEERERIARRPRGSRPSVRAVACL